MTHFKRSTLVGMLLMVAVSAAVTGSLTSGTVEAVVGSREDSVTSRAAVLSSGTIEFRLEAPANSLLLVDVDADIYQSPLDAVIEVIGPDGTSAGKNDDDVASFDAALGLVIRTSGTYIIRVSDAQGRSGSTFFLLLNYSVRPLA